MPTTIITRSPIGRTIIPAIRQDRWVGSNSTVGSFTSATARPYNDKRDDLQAFPYSTGQVVRRRLTRPKIDLSKSFPFLRRNVAPNVGIGRLADNGQSPTTHRAAARNNILSYLSISPIQRPHRLVRVFSNNTPQAPIIRCFAYKAENSDFQEAFPSGG